MGRLVFASITSLDLFVNDAEGNFEWAEPDAEVHGYVNDLERPIGTYLYGRRLYEMMAVWETWDTSSEPPEVQDYAQQWRDTDKVVYSTSLSEITTPRTRLERSFDPDAVRALVEAADHDVSIGGPTLAARAFAAGLVDEHRFAGGVVHLHHRVRR